MKMNAPGDESYNPKCTTDSTKPSSYTMDGKIAKSPGGCDEGSPGSRKRAPQKL